MTRVETGKPQLGQLVRILRGRDLDKVSVIIGIVDSRFILVADGDKRKFDQPKKKNLLHVELLDAVSREVVDSMRETGRVTNGKLRFAVTKYTESRQAEAMQKGE